MPSVVKVIEPRLDRCAAFEEYSFPPGAIDHHIAVAASEFPYPGRLLDELFRLRRRKGWRIAGGNPVSDGALYVRAEAVWPKIPCVRDPIPPCFEKPGS